MGPKSKKPKNIALKHYSIRKEEVGKLVMHNFFK